MWTETQWIAARERLCLKPGVVNLNAGTCSPTVRAAADEALRITRDAAGDPVDVLFRDAPAAMERGKRAAAALLDADPRELLLLSNTSYAVNTVLQSLPFAAGDEIVTSDQEYSQYLPLLARLTRERGVTIKQVKLPREDRDPGAAPADVVGAFRAAFGPKSRLLFASHVTSPTGFVLPVAEIVAAARERGMWTFLDGAHAPGLVPVSIRAIGADFYAANLHKWLMAPASSAILHVRRERRALIRPLMVMGSADYEPSRADEVRRGMDGGPTYWAHSFEYQGTRSLASMMAVEPALAFHREIVAAGAHARMTALAKTCRAMLVAAGLVPVTPAHPELSAAMVAVRYPHPRRRGRTDDVWTRLRREHAIELALPILEDGECLLRVSNAWFNGEADLERMVEVVRGADWA